ncbi:hypothetical protein ACJIZ3_018757 [Penstemon smallii]|uniref:Transmembrane protein n=1 Tax=Penstemon smallii TaxID=265156 RepID=A0ABD3SZB4_9LAMI
MEMSRFYFVITMFALVLALVIPSINAQASEPAPAPSSDGVAIDQGIAYLLMLINPPHSSVLRSSHFPCCDKEKCAFKIFFISSKKATED